MRTLFALMLAALLGACSQTGPLRDQHWQAVHPALAYRQFSPLPDSVVQVLRVDLRMPGVQLLISPPAERGQTVPEMASSAGALASINASFFNREMQVRGVTISEGEAWAPVLAQQSSPLLACDAQLRCVVQLKPPFEVQPGWRNVVAGTPWLLDAGRVRSAEDDAANCPNLCAVTHPRTAVGLDATGRFLYLVVAEGRRPPVLGLTMTQLSAVMRDLGVHDAVNLDGGGSSTMLLLGQTVLARPFNEPQLRKVANALQIRYQPPP